MANATRVPGTKARSTAKPRTAASRTVKATAKLSVPKTRPARKKAVTADQAEHSREAAVKAAQYAIEKKATAVRLLDVHAITSMTDFFVIATGDSDMQVKAIAENVITSMRDKEGIAPWHSEGWDNLQWIIIDFVDFVVHIFHNEARTFYSLERLWADAPAIDVEDTIVPPKKKSVKKAAPIAKSEPRVRIIRGATK